MDLIRHTVVELSCSTRCVQDAYKTADAFVAICTLILV